MRGAGPRGQAEIIGRRDHIWVLKNPELSDRYRLSSSMRVQEEILGMLPRRACGDPASIAFYHAVGLDYLDYVSCSPYRVPIAAAQAALSGEAGSGTA